jgi:putative DNA primase/helicase
MKSADVAARLGGARREGSQWRCCCPLHGGRSLLLRDGREGRLLVYCAGGGCNSVEILRELNSRGLTDFERNTRNDHDFHHQAKAERQRFMAVKIWNAAIPGEWSPQLKRYLESRGITITPAPSLRWTPKTWHSTTPETGIEYPAMIAKIINIDDKLIAIHKTYLTPDGSAKVSGIQDKEYLAPVAGGAVRLAPLDPDRALIVGEGIETTLSLMHLRGLPGWAALSTSGLENLILPREAKRVLIGVDHDRNGAGEWAARKAGQRWLDEGREVRLAIPTGFGDWNDVLRGKCDG